MSIIRPRVWTQQPQFAVGVDWNNPNAPGIVSAFNAPTGCLYKKYTASSPQFRAGSGGVGFHSGYYSTPAWQIGSYGAGNSLDACRTDHFVFRVTSNAAQQGLASIGVSATDGGPLFILQNNSGTLRIYNNSSYTDLGAAVVGKTHVVSITYSDFSPYPARYYLDGVLITTLNGYANYPSGKTIYLGSGYPTASTNADFLLYVGKTKVIDSPEDVKRFVDNHWQIFRPRVT